MTIAKLNKMPATGYDSHTHLNDDAFYTAIPTYMTRARDLNVLEMNVVGYDATGNQRALALAHQYPEVHAILGFQPEDAPKFNAAELAKLTQQLQDPAVVGVGEIGLDYHWQTPVAPQKAAFSAQLDLAQQLNLPVTVHARDAMDDVYTMLKAAKVGDFGGVIHSFTGNVEDAKRFLDLGLYISFSGIVTFKNAKDIQAAAKVVPLERMLVETDAPFLAPTPYRGQQNEPAFVKYVIDNLAAQLDLDPQVLAAQTTANARTLWGI